MFNRVEFWRVRRKEDQRAVSFPSKSEQLLFSVKRGIIHNDHSVLRQGREQTLAEPPLKQTVVQGTSQILCNQDKQCE